MTFFAATNSIDDYLYPDTHTDLVLKIICGLI